ncbi:MAG: hypothetical protein V7731_08995 [Amphritea sp.]
MKYSTFYVFCSASKTLLKVFETEDEAKSMVERLKKFRIFTAE